MSHPPQPNYQQYAIRPQQLSHGYAAYPSQGPTPQQDPQRYYAPTPQPGRIWCSRQWFAQGNVTNASLDQMQYPTQSPSPNQRPGAGGTPAPFFMAGVEVPPQGGPPPVQQQQYPQRDQGQRLPPSGKQPAPIQTSSPPPANTYAAYNPNVGNPPAQGPGPQSTYGNPQELSTSVYDSPIATHNPNGPNSAATYSSSVYSPDEPSAPAQDQSQGYTTYNAYAHPSQPGQNPYGGQGYDGAPPQPMGQAPPIPQAARPAANVMTPPPLNPSGAAYDARQSLPSRLAGAGSPSAPGPEPQYKAYVPPAQNEPSAPSDYYRQQPGGVSY